jgi:hypothetical protein
VQLRQFNSDVIHEEQFTLQAEQSILNSSYHPVLQTQSGFSYIRVSGEAQIMQFVEFKSHVRQFISHGVHRKSSCSSSKNPSLQKQKFERFRSA